MAVNLRFGMHGYVAVQDAQNRHLYNKVIASKEEAVQWIEYYKPSIQGWSLLKSSFVPVRTDNWKDLTKDLFLPTFVNHALKVNSFVLRLIASVFALAWDVVTLAPRLITLPFRAYFNTPTHLPVLDLIQKSPYFKEAMEQGTVQLIAHIEDVQVTKMAGEVFERDDLNHLPYEATKAESDLSCEVQLKELPWHAEKARSGSSTSMYIRNLINGRWNCQANSSGNTSFETYSV